MAKLEKAIARACVGGSDTIINGNHAAEATSINGGQVYFFNKYTNEIRRTEAEKKY